MWIIFFPKDSWKRRIVVIYSKSPLSDCNWTRTHNHLVHKPVWLKGWVFVYDLSGCGSESSCSHLNFKFRTCFEKGFPSHSDNYRVWIPSETCRWHDKNISQLTYLSNDTKNSFVTTLSRSNAISPELYHNNFKTLYCYRLFYHTQSELNHYQPATPSPKFTSLPSVIKERVRAKDFECQC